MSFFIEIKGIELEILRSFDSRLIYLLHVLDIKPSEKCH